MSARYLQEYAEQAILALAVARKEAAHLAYTQNTLFSQVINLEWVGSLGTDEEKAEKIDAFVSRFGRLQDFLGEKLIPVFANLLGERPKSMLDVLAYAEKMQWLKNEEIFIGARKLRNLLVHEYMIDTQLILQALLSANEATDMLLDIVKALESEAESLGIDSDIII